jgi:hypothetical protein
MALINSPYLAPGQSEANRVIRFDIPLSVTCVANNTFVGTGSAFTIPSAANGGILRALFVSCTAPGGTAGGDKTVQIAVGTEANADADLSDAADVDVMVSSGDKTAAFVHGDAANDHVDAYFPVDNYGKYLSSALTLYLNYLGKSSTAGTTNGTVTTTATVWAFIDYLG